MIIRSARFLLFFSRPKDSQLLLQLGSFAEGVQAPGHLIALKLSSWTKKGRLRLRLQGDRAIGLQCFSPLCHASLQRALAETEIFS